MVSRSLDSPPLEGEADGEDGAEEHREPDDEGEDDGVLTFHVQRGGEVCKGCNKRDIEDRRLTSLKFLSPLSATLALPISAVQGDNP